MKHLWIIGCFFLVSFSLTTPCKASEQTSLVLDAKGVGPISAATKFDQVEIQKLLPQLTIKKGSGSTEGEEFPVLQVFDKSKLLLTINPGGQDYKTIFSVVIKDNDVRNAYGAKLGSIYKDVYKSGQSKCSPGMEEMSGTVSCEANESSHVLYVFSGAWNGPDGEIPPQDTLDNWKIIMIAWRP